MAKKWKSYPWTDREGGLQILDQNEPSARQEEDDEEIDVVGDANDCSQVSSCWVPIPAPNGWSPSSPTAGATAPSPPPAQSGLDMASRIAVLYNGESCTTSWIFHPGHRRSKCFPTDVNSHGTKERNNTILNNLLL